MMDLIDSKFVNLLSPSLNKFKKVKNDLYTFRCPLCGDSKKNKNKTRGYLYPMKSELNFKCHNCGASMSFRAFLKHLDMSLYKQYSLEKFKKNSGSNRKIVTEAKLHFEKPKFKRQMKLPSCETIDIARQYLENRRLDPKKFYWAEDFDKFVKTFDRVSHMNLESEPRIIIPIYYDGDLVGFQGRSLNSKSVKYITIMLHDNAPKIYGLDDITRDEKVFITEGPFDSTFIRNSIAMCGADADVRTWDINDPIWIYDNEPRNREIVSRIRKVIARGEKVVIWPTNLKEKDINDMVISGHDVQSMVELNTYSGLEATLKFTTWKKI